MSLGQYCPRLRGPRLNEHGTYFLNHRGNYSFPVKTEILKLSLRKTIARTLRCIQVNDILATISTMTSAVSCYH